MAHAEICPICKGKGEIKGIGVVIDGATRCNGCSGSGRIIAQDLPPSIPIVKS